MNTGYVKIHPKDNFNDINSSLLFILYLSLIVSIVIFCMVLTSLQSLASGMTVFDGSNFSEWYERVQFSLGVLDLDLALITDKPPEVTDDSTPEQVEQSKAWARSNRLSLMFMRMTIANNIKTSLPQTEFASEFLKLLRSASNALISPLQAWTKKSFFFSQFFRCCWKRFSGGKFGSKKIGEKSPIFPINTDFSWKKKILIFSLAPKI